MMKNTMAISKHARTQKLLKKIRSNQTAARKLEQECRLTGLQHSMTILQWFINGVNYEITIFRGKVVDIEEV